MRVKDVALRGLKSVRNHRFLYFVCLILTINLLGLGLIRHELLSGPKPRLRVLAALPSGFADKADRLVLEVDDALGKSDQLGKPLDKSPFAITPAVAGHWQWGTPQRLEFLPDKPLPLGRLFSVQAAADIEVQTGRRLVGDSKFEFRTTPLAVQTCQLAATDREHITLELIFNQPVHPGDLLRSILVRDQANKTLTVNCLTKDPAAKLTVQAERPVFTSGHCENVRVLVREGLKGHGAELGLLSNQEYPLQVESRFCLLNSSIQTPRLVKELTAFVNFSSDIDVRSPLPAIAVSPEVKGFQVSRVCNRLEIRGEFEPSRSYKVTVPATLLSADGQTLGHAATTTLTLAEREPCISFADGGNGVLSPNGKLALDVQAVNITGVKFTASRVHANNLVAHLSTRCDEELTSRELPAKEFKLDIPRDQVKSMVLDLRDVAGQKPLGIYRIRGVATQDRWTEDEALVRVTDLGMTVKSYKGGALVWVTSLATAKPIAGATVSSLTKNNQTVAVATTDAAGLAVLPSKADNPDGPVWVVTAQLGEDLSYVKSDDDPWVIEEVDQGGRTAPETYEAFVYAERGIYRPGETIHLTGIVRDATGKVPPQMPLAIRVRRPDRREMANINVTSDASQGIFQADYAMCPQCWSGTWSFEVTLPGSDKSLGRTRATVEAFVPIRIEVNAAPTKALYGPKDTPIVDVTGRYLFGPPAAGLATSIDGLYTRIAYQSSKYKQYVFDGGDDQNKTENLGSSMHELDGQGHASLKLRAPFMPLSAPMPTTAPATTAPAAASPAATTGPSIPPLLPAATASSPVVGIASDGAPHFPSATTAPTPSTAPAAVLSGRKGLFQARVSVTVTEDGGRSVSATTGYRIDTAARHVGLAMPQENIVRAGAPLEVPYAVIDSEDHLAAGGTPIEVTLTRLQWDWCVEQVNGRPTWKNTERVIPVKTFRLDGKEAPSEGKLALVCPETGRYKLRIVDVSSGMATEAEFYASGVSGSGESSDTNLVQRPQRVEVVLGREKVTPGSTADVLVRCPFVGTLLVTLETDHVLWSKVIEMTAKSASLQVTVPQDVIGGAFVSATVVRAVDSDQEKWLPHRAMGMARLATDHQRNKLPLTIDAGNRCQPGEKVRVAIKSSQAIDPARSAVVHLWAVDDGILLTTRFKTPDPIAHFFAPRALAVASCDLFDQLLPDYKRPVTMSRIGAGGGERDSKAEDELRAMRITPVPLKHRPSAVVWQKFVTLGQDGTANVDLQMPDITGRLRLMAVAVDQDKYATAERPVTLDAPLMIEPSLPRFAAPGDEFVVPVKVFNNTPDKLAVFLSGVCVGNVKAKVARGHVDCGFSEDDNRDYAPSEELQQLHIPPLSSQTVGYTVTAGEVGDAKITFSANAPHTDYKATETCDLSIAAVTPLHSVVQNLRVEAGKEIKIDPPKELQAGSAKVVLAISGRPDIDLRPAIERLIDYPYGCVEQTTSRMYPMLYAAQILGDDGRSQGVKEMVQAGIYRLWSMQTTDGGLAYWPGGRESTPWGTSYAALCLATAKQAGYEIDKKFTDELAKYLVSQLNVEPDDKGHGEPNTKAMICHVLAIFGQPAHGWMSFLAERLDQLDVGGRAHLAAAYIAAGRRDLAAKCLPQDTINHLGVISTSGRITSGIAQKAQLLSVMLDLDKTQAGIPGLAGQLNQARKDIGYWGTTLDNASCIVALCRYQLSAPAAPDFTGTASWPGGKSVAFKHDAVSVTKFNGFAKPIAITSQGKGDIYISLQAQGLLAGGNYETYDRQLEIRRAWKDTKGVPVDLAKLHVGDLVKVEIMCRTTNGTGVDNVAVVDGLPACAEIENPAIATSTMSAGTQATPSDVQMLDDRAVLFVSAGPQERQYSYMVRIISAGRFQQPPIQGSCMYDTGYVCVNGGRQRLIVDDAVVGTAARRAATTQPATPMAATSKMDVDDDPDAPDEQADDKEAEDDGDK